MIRGASTSGETSQCGVLLACAATRSRNRRNDREGKYGCRESTKEMTPQLRDVSNRYSTVCVATYLAGSLKSYVFSIDAQAELDHAVNAPANCARTSRLNPDFSTEVSRRAFHGHELAYHGDFEKEEREKPIPVSELLMSWKSSKLLRWFQLIRAERSSNGSKRSHRALAESLRTRTSSRSKDT